MKRQYSMLFLMAFTLFSANLIANPWETVSIVGTFHQDTSEFIKKRLDPGLTKAQDIVDQAKQSTGNPNLYFNPIKTDKYHISLSTLESTQANGQLTRNDVNSILNLTNTYFKTQNGYQGNFYKLFAFVHGFDRNGNEIHHHCATPKDLEDILNPANNNDFSKAGSIISHIHFVLRFGTKLPTSAHPEGKLKRDATTYMNHIKAQKNALGFEDIYENKGEYTSHLTIANIKSFKGGSPTNKTDAIPADLAIETYKAITSSYMKWRTHQSRRMPAKDDTAWFTLDGFKLRGEHMVNGKRTLDDISVISTPKVPTLPR